MQYHRCHPALRSSRHGPTVRTNSVHLHQSDLDGACGPHCLLMALMILGILRRPELTRLYKARGKTKSMWKLAARSYFVGTGIRALKSMLEPYAGKIVARIYRKHLVRKVLDALADSGVAIVGISNEDFSHWVLAVGVGGVESEDAQLPNRFLILDPELSTIPLSAWNATLFIKSNSANQHAYDTATSRTLVYVDEVLTLKAARE